MFDAFGDPARIDTRLDSRAIRFESPTGAKGRGGTVHGGRKGAPQRIVAPGERMVLASSADLARRSYERPHPLEAIGGRIGAFAGGR